MERGYRPADQLIGYILPGDPTYITNHSGARQLAAGLDCYDLLEDLLWAYLTTGGEAAERSAWLCILCRRPGPLRCFDGRPSPLQGLSSPLCARFICGYVYYILCKTGKTALQLELRYPEWYTVGR